MVELVNIFEGRGLVVRHPIFVVRYELLNLVTQETAREQPLAPTMARLGGTLSLLLKT